ncbi:hypothetical protein BC835DRAFT_1307150 [Cytidiella melzeri]|nr:hypothetical protein BC835DRAFT_1307150 [Cytidiella melzeri]
MCSLQKCDGTQPMCNQCIRFNRAAESRILEQHISRLESRISELETDDPNAVRLNDPYSQSRSASGAHAFMDSPTNWWDMPEPPVRIQQILVQYFLRHESKLGFFLDAQRFLNNMASAMGTRPPSVICNVVYLWGITLSRNAQYTQHESKFLSRALQSVHVSLSACSTQQYQHEETVLDVLQASILLANYFFHHNRLLEGKFHASAAVSLAHMCHLHKIFSPAFSAASEYLSPTLDVIEECERIHAWWAVFVLDKSWVAALSAPSMINEEQELGTVVDTPWPVSMEVYRQQPLSSRLNLGSTTKRFFADALVDQGNQSSNVPSYAALLAKAAALYERANFVASFLDENTPNYQAALTTFDGFIERFKYILPPIERSTQLTPEIAHALLLIHCLSHCATIQLHRPLIPRSSTSMTRCLTAANTVISIFQALDVKQMEFINPIAGVLASTASDMLVLGLRSLRSSRTAWASSAALPGEGQFAVALTQLCAALDGISGAPFIDPPECISPLADSKFWHCVFVKFRVLAPY